MSDASAERLAQLAHDLRTPLTGILSVAELLLDHELDGPTTRGFLESILGSARRLEQMVAELDRPDRA